MSIFSEALELRGNPENPSTSLSDPDSWLFSVLGATKADSGISVNERTALTHSAVWNAVQILTFTKAYLSIDIFEEVDGNRVKRPTLPAHRLLNHRAERNVTSFTHNQSGFAQALLWGNYLADIERDNRGAPTTLRLLDVSKYSPETEAGSPVIVNRETGKVRNMANTLHVPGMGYAGFWGLSVIGYAKNSIGLGLATERFGNKFFSNGTNLSSYIEFPGKFKDDDQKKEFARKWKENYGGLDRSSGTAVLDQGMKLHQLGIPPEDAQFLQTRKFTIEDVARWYNLPVHMLKELARSTNNNIEHQGIEFVQYSLNPWLKKFEQEYESKLLTEEQLRSGRFKIRHNVNSLLRGDIKSQGEFIDKMISNGVYSINKGLGYLGENGIGGLGDKRFINTASVPLDRIDEYIDKIGGNNGET